MAFGCCLLLGLFKLCFCKLIGSFSFCDVLVSESVVSESA